MAQHTLSSSAMKLGSVNQLADARALRAPRHAALPNRSARPLMAVAGPKLPAAQRTNAAAAAVVALLAAAPAQAEVQGAALDAATSGVSVDGAVNSVIEIVKAAGKAVQQGVDVAGVGVGYAKDAYDKVAPVVKNAADVASPYVQSAVNTVKDVATPALQAAKPTVASSFSEAEKLLQAQGLNPRVVVDATKQASGTVEGAVANAQPTINSVVNFLTTSSPTTLAEYGAGAAALWFLGPWLLKGVFGSFRGYAGDVSAAAALDAVTNDRNTYIIDIRTAREKEQQGSPDVPSGGRLIDLEYATVEDRRLRSQLRNVSSLELEVTTLEVAALKKIGKGSTLLLLDRSGATAKAVAKALNARGFRKAFVIQGGFQGWTNSKLRTKLSKSVSSVEILPPVFGTIGRSVSGNNKQTNRRALPSGR